MTKALVRIAPKYRPVSGELQGYRLQACIPNLAGRKMVKTSKGFRATSEEVPAFRAPYLLEESMDYSSMQAVSEADVERFVKGLQFSGYSRFEPATKLDPEELTDAERRIYDDFEILSN